jgi:hypothetical protein
MRIAKLCLAATMIGASAISAAAVETVNPLEVLNRSKRSMGEFDRRMKRDAAEQRRRTKEQEALREKEKAQEAQRKPDAATGEGGTKCSSLVGQDRPASAHGKPASTCYPTFSSPRQIKQRQVDRAGSPKAYEGFPVLTVNRPWRRLLLDAQRHTVVLSCSPQHGHRLRFGRHLLT